MHNLLLPARPPARPPACLQINIYADEDGARKEEIAQLRLGTADNVFRWGMGRGCAAFTEGLLLAGPHAALPMLALYLRSWAVLLHPLTAPRCAMPADHALPAVRAVPACSNFYDRLKEVREYHRKFPDDDLTEASTPYLTTALVCWAKLGTCWARPGVCPCWAVPVPRLGLPTASPGRLATA
jgi:hypothetical protein